MAMSTAQQGSARKTASEASQRNPFYVPGKALQSEALAKACQAQAQAQTQQGPLYTGKGRDPQQLAQQAQLQNQLAQQAQLVQAQLAQQTQLMQQAQLVQQTKLAFAQHAQLVQQAQLAQKAQFAQQVQLAQQVQQAHLAQLAQQAQQAQQAQVAKKSKPAQTQAQTRRAKQAQQAKQQAPDKSSHVQVRAPEEDPLYTPGKVLKEAAAQESSSTTHAVATTNRGDVKRQSGADVETRSDCSTTDTAHSPSRSSHESKSPMRGRLSESEGCTSPASPSSAVQVLRLQDSLAEPEVGTLEIPTAGSRDHRLGICKPCAFVHRKEGCKSGATCKFCHLCDQGARKQRKRDKHQMLRAMRQLPQETWPLSPSSSMLLATPTLAMSTPMSTLPPPL
mmetsp:Transcript_1765/g.4823  ORF Transcript_1765/g.4823 Transcript_1765/m.4823 type:complete len:392 (-) Transcript_1765:397-1572(-)